MQTNYIDEEKLKLIRTSVDIVDIIGEYIPLTGAGKNYFGVCPFHDDHSPSMSVSKDLQIYKCFSCGAGGNVFKFVQDYENVSFIEAVKIIADKAGIMLDVNTKPKVNKNKDYYEMYDLATKLYSNNINTKLGITAKEYLLNRGIDNNIIKEFKIGLALNSKDNLFKLLEKKGFDTNSIENYGLANKHSFGYTDIFYNRIIVPLFDYNGNPIGFSGRIYDNSDENKYVNTKQTVVFKKGELLYNYHRAKNIARKKNQIIIVEGYMDVIGLYKVGIENVIATMGTAVTKEQITIIKKMAKEVILMFDGDKAGEKATWVATNMLLDVGVNPHIVRLEDNLDPDEYIKKNGLDKIEQKISHPINVMEFKLKYLKKDKDFTNNLDISKYANEVIDEINKIEDDILREITLKKLSKEINIDIELLRKKTKKIDKPIIKKNKPIKITKYQKAEQILLYHMLNHTEVMKIYQKRIVFLPTDRYRNLGRAIKDFYDKYGYVSIADIMTFLRDDNSLIETINEINNQNIKNEYVLEEIDDYLKVIQDYNIKNEIKRLKQEMTKTNDLDLKIKISNQILEINRKNKSSEE